MDELMKALFDMFGEPLKENPHSQNTERDIGFEYESLISDEERTAVKELKRSLDNLHEIQMRHFRGLLDGNFVRNTTAQQRILYMVYLDCLTDIHGNVSAITHLDTEGVKFLADEVNKTGLTYSEYEDKILAQILKKLFK